MKIYRLEFKDNYLKTHTYYIVETFYKRYSKISIFKCMLPSNLFRKKNLKLRKRYKISNSIYLFDKNMLYFVLLLFL